MRPAAEGEGTREDWGECRQTPLFGELSKVIPLGQLLPCHSPWEELVLHRGDVCGQQCFRLPPLLSFPAPCRPRSGRASSLNAGPCIVRARFSMASSASLGYAGTAAAVQDVKRTNGGASGHTSLANGADRPVTNPEGFAAQEFGRRDNGQSETSVQCSTVHWVAFLPSSQLQLVIENTDSEQENR